MHRSGTSLTAQWLKKCGLNIGMDLLGSSPTNKDGHFEDIDFHNLHEEILSNHEIPYGGFKGINKFAPTTQEIEKLKTLINHKDMHADTAWGWKDPRTCLFINDYLKLTPELKTIVILRDYKSIIISLLNRKIKGLDSIERKSLIDKYFYQLLLRKYKTIQYKRIYTNSTIIYYQKILSAISKTNTLVVSVETIQKKDKQIIKQLNDWGFNLEYYPISKIFKPNYISKKNIRIPNNKTIEDLQNKIKNKGIHIC